MDNDGQDGDEGEKLGNNTSTPNKTDPEANLNGNLLDLTNEEQDEDSFGRIRENMSKLRKYDQYDCKLLLCTFLNEFTVIQFA